MKLSTTSPTGDLFGQIRRWAGLHPHWALTLIVLAVLALFLPKPFNIDDPLFIWSARHIQSHPADPYGFDVNWYGAAQPMWSITENPPLACYYLAAAAKIFGWGEIGLHFAFLLPALAVVLGTHRLAGYFCGRPMLAALATLAAPVFLVSSTTVMCDVMMLAFWVWAIVFWVEGMERNSFWLLTATALLVTLAMLTKYFGACLVPLLAAHGMFCKRGPKFWILPLLIPLAALGFYQAGTMALYGHGLFSKAAAYSATSKDFFGFSAAQNALIGLAFAGGCAGMTVFFAPWLWRMRTLSLFAGFAVLLSGLLFASGQIFLHYNWMTGSSWFSVQLQLVFWAFGGVGLLALAVMDLHSRRDAAAGLLFLWVLGTFLFAAFFNWTVNARSLLPLTPVVAILLARRLEQKYSANRAWPSGLAVSWLLSGVFGLLVARADFLLAVAVRESAWLACEKYGNEPVKLEFQGHWGFQYYAEESGALPCDVKHLRPKAGVCVAIPLNNTGMVIPDESTSQLVETFAIPGPRWFTTWSGGAGAGFYAAARGPLPFAFNHVPPEVVAVYVWNNPALKK